MHIPEAQLRDYVRVFLPDGDVEAELDRIAEVALAEDLQNELGFFRIAHQRLSSDAHARVTPQMEAAVLVAEVGLDPADVAAVLDLPVADVAAAVAAAWQDAAGELSAVRSAEPAEVPEPPPPRRWPLVGVVVLLVCVVAVVAALIGTRLPAGADALTQRGMDPGWAIAGAVLLLAAGVIALAAGRALDRRRAVRLAPGSRGRHQQPPATADASDAPTRAGRRSAPASPPTSPR